MLTQGEIQARLARAARWLAARPSYMLLTASPERMAAQEAGRFSRAWLGLLIQSIVWGLALTVAWALGERFLVENLGLKIMPAMAAVSLMFLWPFRQAAAATAHTLGGADPANRSVVVVVLILGISLGLIGAKSSWYDWYPDNASCRALLLMPLWGCWAMLITSQFCKCTCQSEPAIEAFAKGCGPIPAAFSAALPWVGTWFYFKHAGWAYLSMSVVTTLFVLVGGAVLCRVSGGLTRRALLTGNMLTQYVFLLMYLGVSRGA